MSDEHSTIKGFSLGEISRREPYLALSILFLCLRIILSVFPTIMPHLKAFCSSYVNHLSFQKLGQVMERVLHVMDVKRIWTKLELCKSRSFQERARSARVWASSLASVSLGDSSAKWWFQISMYELTVLTCCSSRLECSESFISNSVNFECIYKLSEFYVMFFYFSVF